MNEKGSIPIYKKEKIRKAMKAFSYTANVPVTFFDEEMNVIWDCMGERKICNIFVRNDSRNEKCNENLRNAAQTAMEMGEPYIFTCASGLVGIMYPLVEGDVISGTFLAGPIVMGDRKEDALKILLTSFPNFRNFADEIMLFIESNEVKNPLQVSYMYEVFSECVFSYKLAKDECIFDESFIDRIAQLVKRGDRESALVNFNLFYERTSISNVGYVSHIKKHMLKCIRHTINTMELDAFTMQKYEGDFRKIGEVSTHHEIYNGCIRILNRIFDEAYEMNAYDGKSTIIKEALSYISENYTDDITLIDVANHAHVNPSYLSALLKRETELTFSQHLNYYRIKKSIDLLKNTSKSLDEIALDCGFSSTSYFIRQFKKIYHNTPGKYRSVSS